MHFVGVIMNVYDFNRHIVNYRDVFLLEYVNTVRLDTSRVNKRPNTTVSKISNYLSNCVRSYLYTYLYVFVFTTLFTDVSFTCVQRVSRGFTHCDVTL